MYIDTAKEKAIGLGADYPFEPLASGECIVPDQFRVSSKAQIGDTVTMNVDFYHFFNTWIAYYNAEYEPYLPIP